MRSPWRQRPEVDDPMAVIEQEREARYRRRLWLMAHYRPKSRRASGKEAPR